MIFIVTFKINSSRNFPPDNEIRKKRVGRNVKGIGYTRERQEMEGNVTKDRAREKSASSTGNKSISGIPIEHPQTAANNQFQVYALNFSVSLPHICLWHSTCFDFLECVCISTIPYKYHLHVYIYSSNIQKRFMGKYLGAMYPYLADDPVHN